MNFKWRRKTEIISAIITFIFMVLMYKFLVKTDEYLLMPAIWVVSWLVAKFIEMALFEICIKNKTIIIANIIIFSIILVSLILITKFLLNDTKADEIIIQSIFSYLTSTILEYFDLRKEKLKLEKQ